MEPSEAIKRVVAREFQGKPAFRTKDAADFVMDYASSEDTEEARVILSYWEAYGDDSTFRRGVGSSLESWQKNRYKKVLGCRLNGTRPNGTRGHWIWQVTADKNSVTAPKPKPEAPVNPEMPNTPEEEIKIIQRLPDDKYIISINGKTYGAKPLDF